MRIRHKVPTLVSMWMLDVFCCALGCVTLLFLINSRMASDAADTNRNALTELAKLKQRYSELVTNYESEKAAWEENRRRLFQELDSLRQDKEDLSRHLALLKKEVQSLQAQRDADRLALADAEKNLRTTQQQLTILQTQSLRSEELLRKKQKETDDLQQRIQTLQTTQDDLQRLLRVKDDEMTMLSRQLANMKKQLHDLEVLQTALRQERDAARTATEQAVKKAEMELQAAQTRIRDLTQRLEAAQTTIIDLQGQKARLADRFDQLQKSMENRFAGIVTTGQRVVFIVDISGSMAKKDTNTVDPNKWPLVVETVGKVMRSIVGLKEYQVIIFSSSARWLFHDEGNWRAFRGEESVKEVIDALLKTQPYDDTNLYAAFELAFTLRSKGLDTIYLFSDGLPTSGPGLSPADISRQPPLSELERSDKLSRHLLSTLRDQWNRPDAAQSRVRIHSVGFYFESPELGAFLWTLARDNDGSFVGMSKP
ncbi:vWA domain-containing protein [Thermogemmata fonticola]|uniref:VWA domain-containing protein n=1 Tax=Thermogemmata fonticola TaxID=2755323 RepID=A0A7V8VFV2_9BACT|nr:vWA domain-containing protein [Thermogemmata fonticola]MBA2227037.1 VWA domain-containing protein [Thermogemmata fonticola]